MASNWPARSTTWSTSDRPRLSAGRRPAQAPAACRVLGTDGTSVRYQALRPDDGALRERLKALAQERRRFGYRRLHVLLRRGQERRWLALHRAGQVAAERRHRELQRQITRRTAERDAVPIAAACPCRVGGLAARLQRGPASFQAKLGG
jgi:hypothetical protein